jgi:hypothetical protein
VGDRPLREGGSGVENSNNFASEPDCPGLSRDEAISADGVLFKLLAGDRVLPDVLGSGSTREIFFDDA